MSKLRTSLIDSIINESLNTFNESQRTINNYTGWHQHLGTNKIGVVATSMALIFYRRIMLTVCPQESNVINFILDKQNTDGGWAYISNTNEISNTEATCWAINALSLYESKYEKQIAKAFSFIEKSYDVSVEDSGWGFVNGKYSRTYNTCVVLRSYIRVYGNNSIKGNSYVESALKWLSDIQNEDGAWGERRGSYSSLFFTALVVSTLSEFNRSIDKSKINSGMTWLDLRLSELCMENTSVECYLELIEENIGGTLIRIPFFHYVLPYIIIAYLDTERENNPNLYKCLSSLVKRFKNGSYRHPFVEDSNIKPIWALYDSVVAFSMFRGKYMSYSFGLGKISNVRSDWDNIVYLEKIMNQVFIIRRWNPIRLFDWIGVKNIRLIIIALVIGFFIYLFQFIPLGIIGINNQFLSSMLTSFIASILIIICQKLWTWYRR